MTRQRGVEVRLPQFGDVPIIADRLRLADVEECHAAGVWDIRGAIHEGIVHSTLCYVVTVDGRPEAIFGVRPWSDWGVPWMLGTDVVPQQRRALIALAPRYIDLMLRAYPRLMNHVHARNTKAVRWLRRAGFTLHEARPHPETGEAFHVFVMEA